ncbi:MAG: UDP-3-O-[3-hydroxymyristoyl] glucosamine N-acyltransferase [Halioglobus sp.]
MYSLAELADRLDLTFSGDGNKQIIGLAPLSTAGPDQLTFMGGRKHLPDLLATQAAAVILSEEFAEQCSVDYILAENPYLAIARISKLFVSTQQPSAGVHSTATVSSNAQIHAQASVGPNAVIEGGVKLEADVVVGAGVFVGSGSTIGKGSRVFPNAVIYHGVSIGENCIIHSQAVLGADGFGFAQGPEGWEKICQLGGLRIGADVEIGAATTIDRGALDDTVIEDGVIIDNQVQVGHNCHIGRNTAIAGCCGLAGSTVIGANCTLAGGVGVVGHVEICDNVHITGMSMVTRSITEAGSYSSGTPMANTREWKRSAVRFSQLESIQQRLMDLERRQ